MLPGRAQIVSDGHAEGPSRVSGDFHSEEEAGRVLRLKHLADYDVRCERSAFWDVTEKNDHLTLPDKPEKPPPMFFVSGIRHRRRPHVVSIF